IEKAGASRPFFVSGKPASVSGKLARPATKNFRASMKLSPAMRYYVFRRGWRITNMRAFALGLIFSAFSLPCLAQTVLKSEPLALAPYEVAFVQDSSCGT